MSLNANSENAKKLITHNKKFTDTIDLQKYEEELKKKKDHILPLDQELEILRQLTEFDLGRFLLHNKGLDGYWTSYIILYGLQKDYLAPFEKWLLNSAPLALATRERFYIFQKILQDNLKDGLTLASIPCGIMDDLIHLDTKKFRNINYVGIDYDLKALEFAKRKSMLLESVSSCFYEKDAWDLKLTSQFDVITSNGLNIYEPEGDRVIKLYRNFYNALKSKGFLVTSFATPPPTLSQDSTWKNYNLNDIMIQKALLVDIIGAKFQAFRTEKQTKEQLEAAGFEKIDFIYDSQGMFPTVIAKKGGI